MSVYLDTSVIVPLFLPDVFASRAEAYFDTSPAGVIVGDFVAVEFASVVGIRVRNRDLTLSEARIAFSNLDSWLGQFAQPADTTPTDISVASSFLRRLDLTLRAPDAINLAIAYRLGADLATFDMGMANAASRLGIDVVKI